MKVNNHELVALASLRPPIGKEEIDSYMYQTVGQDAIEVVAAAMDLPLIRRVIHGIAVDQGSEYGNRKSLNSVAGDETEDLFELLSEVKRDQGELLGEMLDAKLDAVLIKVAGIGLTPQHLGKHLSEMRATLMKLNRLYGAHICGEGGEYETMTLDCSLFKSKIVLSEVEVVTHSDSAFGSVAFLSIKKATLEPKELHEHGCAVPPFLSHKATSIQSAVTEPSGSAKRYSTLALSKSPARTSLRSRKLGRWVSVAGIQCESRIETDESIEDEVQSCFDTMKHELERYSLSLQHVSHINIHISSMDLFPRINAIYGTQFGTSPPSRACVGVNLPEPCRVRMDCIAFAEEYAHERQALHVQGISYWAPANIGPYSQAITVGGQVFISGQIGLIPSKMQLPSPRSMALESALSLQHVDRIVSALQANAGGGWPGIFQCAVIWVARLDLLNAARQAWVAYKPEMRTRRPVIFVTCKSIPKDAFCEAQVLVHTGRMVMKDEETGETEEVVIGERRNEGASLRDPLMLKWQTIRTGNVFFCLVTIAGDGGLDATSDMMLRSLFGEAMLVRVFGVESYWGSELRTIDIVPDVSLMDALRDVPTALVPCRAVNTEDADYLCALLVHGVCDQVGLP
ncbi:hypothetical protein FRB96_006305 [Tulasnella sp. 330]|nr:hypothetical protein FRB96_006305 [Tulasnella sp. 330]